MEEYLHQGITDEGIPLLVKFDEAQGNIFCYIILWKDELDYRHTVSGGASNILSSFGVCYSNQWHDFDPVDDPNYDPDYRFKYAYRNACLAARYRNEKYNFCAPVPVYAGKLFRWLQRKLEW